MEPKKKRGSWKPGQSGNPKGRPPGVSLITKMRESLTADLPEILAALVESAKAGDPQAARLILERVLPALKAVEQPIAMSLPTTGTLTEQGRAVLTAAAAGEVAPGQAAQLIAAIAGLARVSEIDELANRITQLENQNVNT